MARPIATLVSGSAVSLTILLAAAAPVRADGGFAPSETVEIRLCARESAFSLSLFSGTYESAVSGSVVLEFGAPPAAAMQSNQSKKARKYEVPVTMTGGDFRFDSAISYGPGVKCVGMTLDTEQPSLGMYDTRTGEFWISVFLTTADGELPVPMPITLIGSYSDGVLQLSATTDALDAGVEFHLAGSDEQDWTASGDAAIPSGYICGPFIEAAGE